MSIALDSRAPLNWQRFWCPRSGVYHRTSDGFLDKGEYASADAKPLADFATVPCLVMLGNPGLGKSQELSGGYAVDQGPKLLVNLGALDPALPLRETLSECPQINQWASVEAAPTLWLDSLDEGVGDIANLAGLLGSELGKLKQALPQLRLRITCRVGNWPASLERVLKHLWPDAACTVLELLPLREQDAKSAAIDQGVEPGAFLRAVRLAKAGPLAAKPITLLRMLLPQFKDDHRLAGSQTELYEKGCKRLAAEWAMARQERTTSTNNEAETRFQAAQFVAAAMVFYGRNVLDCTPGHDTGEKDAIHSREIGAGADIGEDSLAVPTIAVVEAVAKTALMAGAESQHLYRFEHRTFQEFLAARFLYSQKMPLAKVLTLFRNPGSPDKRVVPQLIETAAWLAALHSKFRDALLDADPVAVLHSDIAAQDEGIQRKLFASLCEGLRKGEISESEWIGWQQLPGLCFEGVADEIQAILDNATEPPSVREFAIDVAGHAKIQAVYDRLADLALDTARPLREREHCTYALARRLDDHEANHAVMGRLAPLLNTTPAEDPDDTLRGNALHSLWHDLDPDSLFAALRPKHNPDFSGAYWTALIDIRRGLEGRHVLAGLAWAARQPQAHKLEYDLRRLMSRVFSLAWENLDQPGVLGSLARAAAVRMSLHENVRLDDDGEEDYDRYNRQRSEKPDNLASGDPKVATRRRKLCTAMIPHLITKESGAFWLVHYLPIVQARDFEWLLEQHVAETAAAERNVWLELALRVWQGSAEQVALVRRTGKAHESVRDAFRVPVALLDPLSPESKARQEQMEREEQELRELQAKRTPEPLVPPPAQRIDKLLREFERGKRADAWWQLDQLLRVDDFGRWNLGQLEPDIRSAPTWQSASPELRARVLQAAKAYVVGAQEDVSEWHVSQAGGSVTFGYKSASGLSALMLLFHEKRAAFDVLSSEVWARWANVVLDHPYEKHGGVWHDLTKAGFDKAPDAFRTAVARLLRAQAKSEHGAGVLWRLEPIWDEPLCDTVFEVVTKEQCSPAVLTEALALLLEHAYKPARGWCLARIGEAAVGQAAEQQIQSSVDALLRNRPTRDEWTKLWGVLANPSHKNLALEVLGKDRLRREELWSALSELQLADFYIWLRRTAPAAPRQYGFHAVGTAELLDRLQQHVLDILMQRGTAGAIEQCERIHDLFKDDWLRRVIVAAKISARQSDWRPLAPQDLWRYVAKAKTLLARGEHELCDAVMEALERINGRLQGATPLARFLWDGIEPRLEREISLWLQSELDRELTHAGVFIGRELAVGLLNQTDIQVVASAPDEPDFGVIIEVKGCWNKQVKTNMETQLRDKYLAHHSFKHGIYVVGWFFCGAWKPRKPPLDEPFREQSRDDAQRMFEKQAEGLCTPITTVRAFVLNATLPASTTPRRAKRVKSSRTRR